jgi:hypothetical protein
MGRPPREPLIENLSMAIHHPEQRPAIDLPGGSSNLHRPDGAGGLVLAWGNADQSSLPFLIRLPFLKVDRHALGGDGTMLDIDRDKLRSPEGAGEAQEQEGAVAEGAEPALLVLGHSVAY